MRNVLAEDGVSLSKHNFVIHSLTRACRICNDKLVTRLPVHRDLVKMIIKQVHIWALDSGQLYLGKLYKAMIVSAYYGMLRIGEITRSPHCLLATNTHIATNKKKILFILFSSKTHGKGQKPQMIKITSTLGKGNRNCTVMDGILECLCPFKMLKDYLQIWPDARSVEEQFSQIIHQS